MKVIAGKYEVITELGMGGMGVVYLVRHVDLNVNYALKLLTRALSEDKRFIERFKQEAELLLRFSHSGTTQLRDFGRTDDGLYYLAMDYCDGMPLKDVLERDGPYHLMGALTVTCQILDVLEAAHEQRIVHRDIKPGNIMIEEREGGKEVARVLDFGTAIVKKHMGEDHDHAAMGTPCYMSPEQAAGEADLDQRSDIYSAGIVLYELLTGDVPFEGESVVQTLLMHLTQPPVPFAKRYGIPKEVEAVVLRAIEKQREKRFQSATEFRQACEELMEKLPQFRTGASASPDAEVEQKEADQSGDANGGKSEVKILCLDDNEMILHILQHILEKEGYTVYTALDCSAIHNYLFNHKVDLLVSDVQMPGMPGTKICRLLKTSMDDLKVVLFSNIPERDLERHSKENLADGWISKNTKPEEWLQKINDVIDQSME